MRQCHGDAQLHLHAGGVVLVLFFVRQAELLAQLCISGSVPVLIDARHHFARLHRVQAQGDALAAQHHADLLFGADGNSAAVPAEDGHSATVPPHHVQDQPDGGAFARSVFADQAADGAAGQGQVQRPKGKVLIVLCKPLQFQCVHIQPSHSSSIISPSSSLLSPQDADRRTASVRCSSIFFRFSSRSSSVFFGATKKPFAGTA